MPEKPRRNILSIAVIQPQLTALSGVVILKKPLAEN
jgi:hypothetical protein